MLSIPFRKLISPKLHRAAGSGASSKALANASSEAPNESVESGALVKCHFDSPVSQEPLQRPHLHLRGWLTFQAATDLSSLELHLQIDGHTYPVCLEQRPDVAAAFPNLSATGFHQIINLSDKEIDALRQSSSQAALTGKLPDQQFTRSLELKLDESITHRSSYYTRNETEHNSALQSGELSSDQQSCWQENGYIVVKGFYNAERIDQINRYIDELWQNRRELDCPVSIDEYIGTENERRRLFSEASSAVREHPYKVNDLYLASNVIREIVLNEEMARLLKSLLYSGTPMICSSLYFEKGSQQRKHFDTFFMPPLVRDRMLATWIALEDVTESSGPLAYYPGSHKIKPWIFEDGRFNLQIDQRDACYRYIDAELDRLQIEPEHFLAEKGDLFVWHPQLLHGGDQIHDLSATRKSFVTHYFCREDHPEEDAEEFAPDRFYLKRKYLPA